MDVAATVVQSLIRDFSRDLRKEKVMPKETRKDGQGEIWICTAEDPWKKDDWKGQVVHAQTKTLSEHYDWSADHDDYTIVECLNCHHIFDVTLPN